MIFFKKIQGNTVFSSGFPKRSFQKVPGHDLSCIIWKNGIFFPQKHDIFFLGQETKDDLSQEIHGNMTFSVYMSGCYKPGVTPPAKKNQGWPYPAKIHLKVIDVLD